MTVVLVDLRTDVDGNVVPVAEDAYLQWIPTRRRSGPDQSVILPSDIDCHLTGGVGQIDVAPTTAGWAWHVIERAYGGGERYVLVPDSADPIPYRALLDVDPATLTQPVEPPAWQAEHDLFLRGVLISRAAHAALVAAGQTDPRTLYLYTD